MKILRSTIIEALAYEPLKPGYFFHDNGTEPSKGPDDCSVCAVGAVLRRTIGHVSTWDAIKMCQEVYTAASKHQVEIELERGNYLGALSVFFERLVPDEMKATSQHRIKLIRFVLENFPKSIEVAV